LYAVPSSPHRCYPAFFGGAGGTALLGLLLTVLGTTEAMILFSFAQLTSNASRGWLWREHIQWGILSRLVAGSVLVVCFLACVTITLNKPVVYIVLGAMPFVGAVFPKGLKEAMIVFSGPVPNGALVALCSLLTGAPGVTLDLYFLRNKLSRQSTVATKSCFLLFINIVRVNLYGSVSLQFMAGEGWSWSLLVVLFSVLGSFSAGAVLRRFSDEVFRAWTTTLVRLIACSLLFRGCWLLMKGQ
jgi:uncharacterized membrane protein YfcA